MFDLAATNSKSLDVASLELSGSDEDSECSKTSGGGALGIGMRNWFQGRLATWINNFRFVFLENPFILVKQK